MNPKLAPQDADVSQAKSRKPWITPSIVVERSLVAKAQDPFLGEVDKEKADPFLGPLSASL